jgi:hypothetical protein
MRRRRNIMPCAPNRRRRVGAAGSIIELSFRERSAPFIGKRIRMAYILKFVKKLHQKTGPIRAGADCNPEFC